jgi:molybdopterin/thiamine biosynthesis adenylyltransferase/rhodanese-related sulfurtransferase
MNRFERQINLRNLGKSGQKKLAKASVLVIGAGGLGCPALLYLAAAGVGRIGIIDGDTILISNLNRQVLYGRQDEGKLKAVVAGQSLKEKYDDIDIEIYPYYLDTENAMEIITNYHIVLDCTDNFSVRYMANDACLIQKKPLVYGAIYEYEGQISLFNVIGDDGQAYNYRDIFPIPPDATEVPNCAETGVLGVLPGIIGTMQAAEAIKYLTGIGTLLSGKVLYYNLEYQSYYQLEITHQPEILQCIPNSIATFQKYDYSLSYETVQIIDWDRAKQIFHEKPGKSLFIDVRENGELPVTKNLIFLHLPLTHLEEYSAEVDLPENLLVFCQHGIRSVKAVRKLVHLFPNKNIYSISGGIMDQRSPVNQNI